jgi:hypothetical protein
LMTAGGTWGDASGENSMTGPAPVERKRLFFGVHAPGFCEGPLDVPAELIVTLQRKDIRPLIDKLKSCAVASMDATAQQETQIRWAVRFEANN